MTWFDVDGARDHLGQRGKRPSRKTVYNLVSAGLRVARIGDTGRRMLFCAEWIDEFLSGPDRAAAEGLSDEAVDTARARDRLGRATAGSTADRAGRPEQHDQHSRTM